MRGWWNLIVLWCGMIFSVAVRADGPADNNPETVRPVPPPGIEVPAEQRAELEKRLAELQTAIDKLRTAKSPLAGDALPDLEIYRRAVAEALELNEIFTPAEIDHARELLRQGLQRAEDVAAGKAPWAEQTGLVVRGFTSRLDRTVQPYGLVIPANYRGDGPPVRLDVWLHGRGEKVSELVFLKQRSTQVGSISPPDTIVLQPYGRYSNAFKFAGEIDVLEAIADVQRRYRIDPDRIAIRGFSMGGAGCWQFAVHYPDRWFAATPGAGFSETPEFLKHFQKETLAPTPWEEKLWRLYDCPGYAINLLQCPTIAYSGENDIQKQAADVMERALAEQQIRLTHLIGPQTGHSIHPDAAAEIERRLASIARQPRIPVPTRVQFATFTLRYNRVYWLTVTGLEKHWEPCRVDAQIGLGNIIRVQATNVTGLSFNIPPGSSPFDPQQPVRVEVNGQTIGGPRPSSDRAWSFSWHAPNQPSACKLRKQHGLQGPIDDAFMDTFVVVRPTGTAFHPAVEKWTRGELAHFIEHWRKHFRGHAIVKDDTAITAEDIASANLILFGDRKSNAVIERIAGQLPIEWQGAFLKVGEQSYSAVDHAPVLIYPNPLNERRYVVLNSGFTFREYDYLNNARQVPRLPDWAVVDLRSPPTTQYPGKIAAAGFFDEQWNLPTTKQTARE